MKKTTKTLGLLMAVLMLGTLLTGCGKKQEATGYVVLEEDLGAEQYGIGFRNTDVALGLEVQKQLDAMIEDGTAAEISQKWFGEDILLKDVAYLEESTAAADDDSLQKVKDKGTLILGLDDSFPPMGFNNEKGEIVGFDIDLATEVCARLGVELVLQPIDWSAKETLLENGNIDCIWNGVSITPAREESMCMTPAYLNNRIVILTKKDSGIQEAKDLAGKYVAVQSGSFAEEVLTLEEYGYSELYASLAEVTTEADYLYAIMNLQNGMVDAVLIDEVVAQYKLTQLGDESLVCTGSLCDDLYGIGFRKADEALEKAVYDTLIEMAKDGKAAEISNKWFGADLITDVLLAK